MSLDQPLNMNVRDARVALNFAKREIELGLRFCGIMKNARPSDIFTKGAKRATSALRHAEEIVWHLKIQHSEFNDLVAQVELLRFELKNLGVGGVDA